MKRHSTNQKSTTSVRKKEATTGQGAAAPQLSLSPGKRVVLRIACLVLSPLLLLVVLELTLRLVGYGYPTHFFLSGQVHGEKVILDNQRFGWRFFPAVAARTPRPVVLPARKHPGTCRIFIFGESAAYGDPSPAFGLPRVLEVLLRNRFPGIHFEVVNVAMTAINSNVILPIARDCAEEQGDFWILYIGNNEVVGPFGAGTVFGPQALNVPMIRATIALKATRTGQLLAELSDSLFEDQAVAQRSTIGLDLFLQNQIRREDPRMPQVYEHFAANLRDIVRLGAKSGAKVIVSTVASNVKDCAPFCSLHRADLNADQKAQWQLFYEGAVKAEASGDFSNALASYQAAAKIDDRYADLQFRQASALWRLGDFDGARKHFESARDGDALRVRVDGQINGLIKEVALSAKGSGTEVYFVDGNSVLAERSPHGAIGQEMLYEHVHLNSAGNYFLARALAEQVAMLLPDTSAAKRSRYMSQAKDWLTEKNVSERLAFNEFELYKTAEILRRRLDGPPFTTQLTHQEQYARITAAAAQYRLALNAQTVNKAVETTRSALAEAANDWVFRQQLAELLTQCGQRESAIQEWQKVSDMMPHYATAHYELGKLLMSLRQTRAAVDQLSEATRLLPTHLDALNALGQALADNGQVQEAIRTYNRVLKMKPGSVDTLIQLGRALNKKGDRKQAKMRFQQALKLKPDDIEAQLELSKFGEQPAQASEAVKYYGDALKLNPRDAVAHFRLGEAFDALGNIADAARHYAEAVQLQPDFAEAHCQLGIGLGREGRTSEAEAHFREAARLKPDFAQAHVNLGVALAKQHKLEEAAREFEEGLRLDPKDELAQKSLAAVRRAIPAGEPFK